MDSELMKNKVLNLDKSSWVLTKLGDLAKDISKRVDNPGESEYDRFVGLGNFVSGDIKIKSWETTENLDSSAKAFQIGDILFARRNAYLRRASLVDFDGCCSGDAFVLRENHDEVVPGFLAFLMNSNTLWDFANSNAAGTMSKRVKWRDLAEYEFLLPPKEQQAKLSKLLWSIDEVYESHNRIAQSLSIYKSAFVKYEVFLKAIESKSCFVSLGDLFEVTTGNKNAQDADKNGKYPFFTRSIKTQKIDVYEYDQEALFIAGEGNFQVKYYKGKFNVHQRTYILSDKRNHKINMFLYKEIIQAKIEELTQKSVGSTVNSLRKPIIEDIKVPFLSEDEQEKAYLKISTQDKCSLILNEKILSLKNLQKNLINKIF